MKVRSTLLGFVILMLAATACVAPTAAPAVQPTAPPPTSTPEPEMAAAVTLQVAEDPDLGQFLVDAKGNTLYLFLNDSPGTSVCYDSCAENWPPLITEGEVEAGEGVNPDLIGTTERDDGSLQVTYNGWPLYYFVRDEQPGDTTGQDVGDVWYVVSPDGEAVGAEEEM